MGRAGSRSKDCHALPPLGRVFCQDRAGMSLSQPYVETPTQQSGRTAPAPGHAGLKGDAAEKRGSSEPAESASLSGTGYSISEKGSSEGTELPPGTAILLQGREDGRPLGCLVQPQTPCRGQREEGHLSPLPQPWTAACPPGSCQPFSLFWLSSRGAKCFCTGGGTEVVPFLQRLPRSLLSLASPPPLRIGATGTPNTSQDIPWVVRSLPPLEKAPCGEL